MSVGGKSSCKFESHIVRRDDCGIKIHYTLCMHTFLANKHLKILFEMVRIVPQILVLTETSAVGGWTQINHEFLETLPQI